ncbi:hypothetical protein E4T80_12310 [Muribacter muris]|uniref:VENN motif-containing domain-containing protein n=3 Tax=Muribacter muris TaxID=67855 RepID=A0A4Y9JSF9_9PAST|nr:HNH endonuclease [Muribacter muris]MBF0786247.1 HNH endonuclease [Muribacter muris]TFV07395.1 hypothetical protein E4T80_12310 [Muribacter muris]
MSTLMSLPGNRNEREQSTTYATVGGNIDMTIRDEAGQKAKTGKTVAETLSGLHRDVANANRKVSQADMSKVQELQAMAAVVADIVNNAEQIYTHSDRERIENAKLALGKEAERLRQAGVLPENFTKDAGYEAAAKALNTLQSDYDKTYGTGSAFKRGVSAASGILQGLVTGNNAQALVGGLSPYANQFIKAYTAENSIENKIAHGLLSAVEFQLTGRSPSLGALAGIVAESSAEILSRVVFGKSPNDLTEGEKQQVVALSQVASALATTVAGGNGETAAMSMASAKNAVEHNSFGQSYTEWKKEEELRKNDPEAYAKLKEEQFKIFTDALGIAADFTPVLGDAKSFAEAEDSIDYLLASVGIIPGADIVTKPLKEAKVAYQNARKAEKLGNTEVAKQHLDKANSLFKQSLQGIYDSKQIRESFETQYGKDLVTSKTVPPSNAKNVKLAGKKHSVSGVPFDTKGFPIFDDIAQYDTRLNISIFSNLSYKDQMKMATKDLENSIRNGSVNKANFTDNQLDAIFRGDSKIPGYTWHHHQDTGRMQLVPTDKHIKTGHIGGEGMKNGK